MDSAGHLMVLTRAVRARNDLPLSDQRNLVGELKGLLPYERDGGLARLHELWRRPDTYNSVKCEIEELTEPIEELSEPTGPTTELEVERVPDRGGEISSYRGAAPVSSRLRVFISYRRDDSIGIAGRIRDRL